MNKQLKIIVIVGCVLIALPFIVYLFIYESVDGLQNSIHKKDEVVFHYKDTVYIKASAWGLTGDHLQIVVSASEITNRAADSASDYIYFEPTIYYKKKSDSLIIYSLSLSQIPGRFNPNIKIKQVLLKGLDEMKQYDKIYDSLGLKRISVYE